MKIAFPLLAVLGLAPIAWGFDNYKETREIRAAFTGSMDVDASPVGAITVRAWDQPEVLIRAEIEADSSAIASQVAVTESAGVVRATGPVEGNGTRHWAVGYEISLPPAANLVLKANVGAIAVVGITGKIRCGTSVGALLLASLAGDVQCATTVGAISIALAGDHWDGAGLNVRTEVGAIDLTLPPKYSAHLDLSTGLGAMVTNLPLPVMKAGMGRSVSADLGAGGATVTAATRVGAVTVNAGLRRRRLSRP
ncbi:MAG: hypothetical protein LAP87_24060 [Acidobacteriia bacterium]|nr:hypothetical protein [Terriglobia bacterium]